VAKLLGSARLTGIFDRAERALGSNGEGALLRADDLLLAFAEESDAKAIEGTFTSNVGRTFDWLEATTAYGMRATTVAGAPRRRWPAVGFWAGR